MTAPTTTIRVSSATRDRLMRTRRQDFDNASLDEVITHLLDEHADQQLRAQMRIDAERARADADDLAEVRRVQAEMDELSAW
jgi:glucose-6-phosphate-specific signal transduction histidine kinase